MRLPKLKTLKQGTLQRSYLFKTKFAMFLSCSNIHWPYLAKTNRNLIGKNAILFKCGKFTEQFYSG